MSSISRMAACIPICMLCLIACTPPAGQSPTKGTPRGRTSSLDKYYPQRLESYSTLKRMPTDRWETVQRPRLKPYPPIALMARIHGDVTFALEINTQGAVTRLDFISGPVPLAQYMDQYIRQLRFNPDPTDAPGPWSFVIVGHFSPNGRILIKPK